MPEVARRLRGHYLELLGRIHEYVRPRSYLEIGMHSGKSLALAVAETQVVGVDPLPAIRTKVNSNAKLFFDTSDDFFARDDLGSMFGSDGLDLAFIDGMHLFEFALRDFMNTESLCNEGAVIMVHDCFPLDEATTARERSTQLWTGDTWKLVPALQELRPDLEISTVAVNPSGLTLVRGLDPHSTVLRDRYEEAVRRFAPLEFSTIDGCQETALNVIPNDWDQVVPLLPVGPLAAPGSAPHVTKRFPMRLPVLRHQVLRHTKLLGGRVRRVFKRG